jgi:hypothetical protein
MHPCGRARPAKNSVPLLMSATVSTFRAIGNVGGLYDAYLAGGGAAVSGRRRAGGESAPEHHRLSAFSVILDPCYTYLIC